MRPPPVPLLGPTDPLPHRPRRVLVAGGECTGFDCSDPQNGVTYSTALLFDPTSPAWVPASTMAVPHSTHEAVLLEDGSVLVAGGFNGSGPLAAAELFALARSRTRPGT